MTRRLKSQKFQQGGATVEMALLMIIFVPLVLFSMYTSDAVFHTLAVQETVVVTLWDFSTQSYSQKPKPMENKNFVPGWVDGRIAGFERVQYADHLGEYNSEKEIDASGISFNNSDRQHHTQVFGHACWHNGNQPGGLASWDTKKAQEVHCEIDQSITNTNNFYLSPGASYYSLVAGAGGVVTCSAKAWLFNYLIPDTFLAGFGNVDKVKLFNHKKETNSNVHGVNGQDALGADMLLKFRAQLFVDTWAVQDGSNINRSSGILGGDGGVGPNETYFRRASIVYANPTWYGKPTLKVLSYAQKALTKKLIAVAAVPEVPTLGVVDGFRTGPNPIEAAHVAPDDPLGFAISVQFPITKTDADDFYTTPYYDTLKSMYDNRKNNYMGFSSAEKR